MFSFLKLTSPFSKVAASRSNLPKFTSTTFQLSRAMSSNPFPQPNSKRRTKKAMNKTTLLKKAYKCFGQGLLKGPDFFAVEQNIAQREANRLHLKAQELQKTGENTKAIECYKMAVNVLLQSYEEDDPLLTFFYHKLGNVCLNNEDIPQALAFFNLELDIMIENYGEEDARVGKMFLLIGKYQMKERQYFEAVQNLHEALYVYLSLPEQNKRAISSCYSKLAECYVHIGKYEEALENFESLLQFNKPAEESPLLSHYYINFAIALAFAKHKYDEALLYLQNCLNRELSMNGGSSLSSGNCYLKIGQINTMQGKYEEAMESYQKALEITKLIGGNNHRQTGLCYNAIGAAFLGQGKYNEAIKHFKLAMNCFEEKDFELYACYKNIAMTFFKQKNYDTAITNFQYSIEERSKLLESFTEADAECAALHGFLASLYIRNGNHSESLEHYEQFMETFFKMFCMQASQTIKEEDS